MWRRRHSPVYFALLVFRSLHGAVRLHHAGGDQSRSAPADHSAKHQSVVFPRRKNRCTGPQWFRQIEPVAHHGRSRHRDRRRSPRAERHPRWLSAPRAGFGRHPRRARQCGTWRGGNYVCPQRVQRHFGALCRANGRRRNDQTAGTARRFGHPN